MAKSKTTLNPTVFFLINAAVSIFCAVVVINILTSFAKNPNILDTTYIFLIVILQMYVTYNLVQFSKMSDFMVTVLIRIMPILILAIFNFAIQSNTLDVYKGIGIIAIISGIYLTTKK